MPRSILSALLAPALAVSCAQTSQTPTPTSATVNVPAPSAATAPSPSASEAAADASAATASQDDGGAEAGAVGAVGSVDGGIPAQFRACTMDSDCVAVDRVGCCHNGWKEAVAASQKDAYASSFTCPQPHPVCPMFLVRDLRVPECDNATHLCTMVQPENVACGGFIRNAHRCPDGYTCPVRPVPDIPGKCVRK
jgi:hypothetical protein